jgi:hypothetical protein
MMITRDTIVVAYINHIGIKAGFAFFFCDTSQTLAISRASDAINWFAEPNRTHIYEKEPQNTNKNVRPSAINVPTYGFLTAGTAFPANSVSAILINLITRCRTVIARTTIRIGPYIVPQPIGRAREWYSLSNPEPNILNHAPPFVATAAVTSAIRASIISKNIAPAHTGLTSISFSNCLDVPVDDTIECHPEIAPHAIVTNSIGQSGNPPTVNFVATGAVRVGCPTNMPITAPIIPIKIM